MCCRSRRLFLRMFNTVGENRQLVQVTGGSSHFQVSKRQKCIIDNSIKKSDAVLREFTAKQKWLEITWTLSSSFGRKARDCQGMHWMRILSSTRCKQNMQMTWNCWENYSQGTCPYTNYDTFLINKFVFENMFLIFWGSRTLFLDFWIFFVHVR